MREAGRVARAPSVTTSAGVGPRAIGKQKTRRLQTKPIGEECADRLNPDAARMRGIVEVAAKVFLVSGQQMGGSASDGRGEDQLVILRKIGERGPRRRGLHQLEPRHQRIKFGGPMWSLEPKIRAR